MNISHLLKRKLSPEICARGYTLKIKCLMLCSLAVSKFSYSVEHGKFLMFYKIGLQFYIP